MKNFLLFGTGDYFKRYINWFKDCNVLALIDNDENKQGKVIEGYSVISPRDALKLDFDVIVVLSFYIREIKEQLIQIGVEENKIFHFYDLNELFKSEVGKVQNRERNILLLSHDLTLGGPSLALFNAAIILKKNGYEVSFASMIDGPLREQLVNNHIPVIIDERLQICTMQELYWTQKYNLIICNTINYHVFLTDRNINIPVIWWLHDSAFFYEGIREGKLENIDIRNLKCVSVGPVPRKAMHSYRPDIIIEDLIYGVSDGI